MCALAHQYAVMTTAAEARSAERQRDFTYSAGAALCLYPTPASTCRYSCAGLGRSYCLRATLSFSANARRAHRVALPPEGDMHMTGRTTAVANLRTTV